MKEPSEGSCQDWSGGSCVPIQSSRFQHADKTREERFAKRQRWGSLYPTCIQQGEHTPRKSFSGLEKREGQGGVKELLEMQPRNYTHTHTQSGEQCWAQPLPPLQAL